MRSPYQAIVLLVLAELVWAAPERPLDPVLASLITESLAARPELAEARATAQAERERVPQAGALPDPMLALGVQNDGFTSWEVGSMETSWYSIMASQALPWPGKRSLRSKVAELAADQSDESVARVRLSTEADVRSAYLDLILAQDRLVLLDRLALIWQKSAAIARSRYETGQGAQSDVLRAQLEQNRIKQRRWAFEVEKNTAIQALNRLRGHPIDEPIVTQAHLVLLALPALESDTNVLEDAFDRSPELAAARARVNQARGAVDLAQKSYLPDFLVSVGVMPRGGEFSPMWLVSVGGTLPVFRAAKQSRAVAEAEARLMASEHNVAALEQLLVLRTAQRRTALTATLETIRLYKDGLLVQSGATSDSTLAQYEVGKVTFASVLEANAGLIADQDGYLQALAAVHRLEIDALQVSLAPISPVAMGRGTAAMPGAGTMESGTSLPNVEGPSPASGSSSSMSGM